MNLARREQRQQLYQFFSQKEVRHGLFWLFAFLIRLTQEVFDYSFLFHITNSLLSLTVWACLVYYNQLYLIPNYLTKERVLTYFGLLLLSVLIITPIGNLICYFKFTNYPNYQIDLTLNHNAIFLLNFFVVAASTLVKIISDWVRHQRERSELQTQTMQSELRFLKSQINPHFLFNTLNN